MNTNVKRVVIASTIAAGIAAGVGIGASGEARAPAKPPYVMRNGVPDVHSLPTRVPVAGPNGNQIATVPRECLFNPGVDVDCSALPRANDGDVATESIGPDQAS